MKQQQSLDSFFWPWGLLAVAIFFIIATLGAVSWMILQPLELVEDNYYEKGLRYEERLEAKRRTESLEEPIVVEVIDRELQITIPSEIASIEGQIQFYKPNAEALDFTIPIQLTEYKQSIPLQEISQGRWHVFLVGVAEEKEYVHSLSLTL